MSLWVNMEKHVRDSKTPNPSQGGKDRDWILVFWWLCCFPFWWLLRSQERETAWCGWMQWMKGARDEQRQNKPQWETKGRPRGWGTETCLVSTQKVSNLLNRKLSSHLGVSLKSLRENRQNETKWKGDAQMEIHLICTTPGNTWGTSVWRLKILHLS